MAIEYIKEQIIGRAEGRNAVQSAAYRSCSKLYDETTGKTFDYSNKQGLVHSEIILPEPNQKYTNRETLWNKIEQIENSHNRRKSAQLSLELVIALPKELSLEHQKNLVTTFIKEHYVDKHNVVADLNIHHDNLENPHAHVMLTFRSFKDGEFEQAKVRNMTGQVLTGNGKKFVEKGGLNSKWREYQEAYFVANDIDLSVDETFIIPTKHEGIIRDMKQHEIKQANQERKQLSAEVAISHPELIIELLEEKYSVFSTREIRSIIRKNTEIVNDRALSKKAYEQVIKHPSLIEIGLGEDGRVKYTTQAVVQKEEDLINLSIEAEGIRNKGVNYKLVDNIIAKNKHIGEFNEQGYAIRHVANSGNIVCVVGRAGAGKTYTMASIKEMYENLGYEIRGTSLSEKATRGLEESSGIKSENIKKLLVKIENIDNPKIEPYLPPKNSVLVVDEAGMVGLDDMLTLIKFSKDRDIKLVLVGDPEQLQPIQKGAPFRMIAEHIGFTELSNIIRQKDLLDRIASVNLASGNVGLAIDHYNSKGCIKISEPDHMLSQIVTKWNELKDESVLMLAHTNKDVTTLNALARSYLKEQGLITGEDFKAKGARGTIFVAVGDKIMFTAKDKDLGVYNGLTGVITKINNNNITVKTQEQEITFNNDVFQEFNLSYATTIHKAQGATVDHALVYASGFGYDKHLAYVAMTRHKKTLNIYADSESFTDIDELKQRLSDTPIRDNVLDYPYQLSLRFGLNLEVLAQKAVNHIKQAVKRVADTVRYLATFNRHMQEEVLDKQQKRAEAILIADFADFNSEIRWDYREFKEKYGIKFYLSEVALQEYDALDIKNRFYERNKLATRISRFADKYTRALKLNYITPEQIKEYVVDYHRETLVLGFLKEKSLYKQVAVARHLSNNKSDYFKYLATHKAFEKIKDYESIKLNKILLQLSDKLDKYVATQKLANNYYRKSKAVRDGKQSPKHKLYSKLAMEYYKQASAIAYELIKNESYQKVVAMKYHGEYAAKILANLKTSASTYKAKENVMSANFDNAIFERMLEKSRRQIKLDKKQSSVTPTVSVLGGQPGCGKSSIIEHIKVRSENNIVVINGDEFRELHPQYEKLLAIDPEKAVAISQPYTNKLVEMLYAEAINKKVNIIIEGTMRNPNVPITTAEKAIAQGYIANAYIVSTNEAVSRAGCLFRREKEIIAKGYGRPVSIESHNEAYKNIPNTIDKIIESGKFTVVQLVTKDKRILGDAQKVPSLGELYTRMRELLDLNALHITNKKMDSVIMNMNSRKAKPGEINEALNIKNSISHKISTKLEKFPYVLEEVKTGKVFAIRNSTKEFIEATKIINEKLGSYLESEPFRKALPQHIALYSANDMIKIVGKIPNAPELKMHDSYQWVLKQNIKLSEGMVKQQSKGASF